MNQRLIWKIADVFIIVEMHTLCIFSAKIKVLAQCLFKVFYVSYERIIPVHCNTICLVLAECQHSNIGSAQIIHPDI